MEQSAGQRRPREDDDGDAGEREHQEDRYLPVANISRIMKKALPPSAKVARDAKETVQMTVSEFISFVTSEASDQCQRQKRKTVNGDDLLFALTTLGFDNYVEPLRLYLHEYRKKPEVKRSKKFDNPTPAAMSGNGAVAGFQGGLP